MRTTCSDLESNDALTCANTINRYAPDGKPALNQLSFHLRPKEKVGLVGRTGAGKSSALGVGCVCRGMSCGSE